MRILKVIHGYPPSYNAGSEVYSQALCSELCKTHTVHVFTREENPFVADGHIRESMDANIRLHTVNAARVDINYRNPAIEHAFGNTLEKVKPDIVHIGHLHHLSLGIVPMAAARSIPIVFTLHDFWLMCLRGQFIQYASTGKEKVWPPCDGQDDRKCAKRCLSRFYSGAQNAAQNDLTYWTRWCARRMAEVRRVTELTDIFIAPSRHLARRFHDQFALPPEKTVMLDYGFSRQRLRGRRRARGETFTFGYIGTHIPGKGIHQLLEAFALVHSARADCILRIWGRETPNTTHLKAMVATMPPSVRENIQWTGEYANSHIVREVFNRVDAIVVPSIWEENSPLVIHEAQQARVPVITAHMGGMAEYVRHKENGLLFAPRNSEALAEQMREFLDNPEWAEELGRRGYLYDESGDVPDIESHTQKIEQLYRRALDRAG